MTEPQHALYIRRWICVVRANHWVMRKHRLVENAVRGERSEWHQRVWDAAEMLAAQEHCAVTAEHLRHGCHVVAFGKKKSSWDLTNQEFDRLLIWFGHEPKHNMRGPLLKGLLIDPENLTSVQAWLNPEENKRLHKIEYLRKLADEGKLRALSRNAWSIGDWESLDAQRLDSLISEVKAKAWTQHAQKVRHEEQIYDAENAPF
jgi:hypothetical protein